MEQSCTLRQIGFKILNLKCVCVVTGGGGGGGHTPECHKVNFVEFGFFPLPSLHGLWR